MTHHSDDAAPPGNNGSGLALHWRILIGLVVGGALGLAAGALFPPQAGKPNEQLAWFIRYVTEPVGQIFLRLIFMVVMPLIFTALVLGVAEIGDLRKLGRLGLRTLALTVLLTGISVAIGLSLANLVQPGKKLPPTQRAELKSRYATESTAGETVAKAKKAKTTRDMLLDIIPRNPLQEMVGALDGSSPGGGMLAVMFFALVFGIGVTLAPERTAPLVRVLEGVYDVVMAVLRMAMKLAPYGVAALVFSLAATMGSAILQPLLMYVGIVLLGLALQLGVVYSAAVRLLGGWSPRKFFGAISEAMLTAFATSSSNVTLPTALKVAEQNLKLRPQVSRFVLTVGSTANQNGTALYEGITVLFLAQLFDVDLTMGQQVVVVLMSVLAGIGTAGVPGGSLPLVASVLLAVGIPAEGIGVILGVDRLLDMCRTTLNVTGDLAVAACVDRLEGPQGSH